MEDPGSLGNFHVTPVSQVTNKITWDLRSKIGTRPSAPNPKGKGGSPLFDTETVPEEDARLSPSAMIVVPSRQDSPLVARFLSVGSVFFFFLFFFFVGSLFH